jgi:hypothetical protein
MFIPDLDLGKKAPDPGSGSATPFEKIPSYLENKTKSWAN